MGSSFEKVWESGAGTVKIFMKNRETDEATEVAERHSVSSVVRFVSYGV